MRAQLEPRIAAFLQQVREAMESYFDSDRRRIDHALQVAGYARELLQQIDADPLLTLCAGYLHDIGIPEAERKYGSCTGSQQELEGPPVARVLLEGLGADGGLVDDVCRLVANHHTPQGVDTDEFRILWDADALVNLAELLPGKSDPEVESVLQKSLVTEVGLRRARSLFLSQ